mmetsp:Transcript_21504/g.83435  ORF Transcript_21504/g.83435 Transcript_21504/m.83435 type:complete len:603 (+) Transcript_21504:66-1874(+)
MGKSEAELRREQRRKELEEKRQRLKAMKSRKKEPAAAAPVAEEKDDLDKIKSMSSVDALLGALTSDIPPAAAPAPDIAEKKPEAEEATPGESEPQKKSAPLVYQEKVVEHSVMPKSILTYSKGVQTETQDIGLQAGGEEAPPPEAAREEPASEAAAPAQAEVAVEQVAEAQLSEDEIAHMVQSQELAEFLSQATRVAERALFIGSKYDILVDYAAREGREGELVGDGQLPLLTKLYDDRWSKNRALNSLSWSHKYNELVLGAYSTNVAGSHDADGVVLAWTVQNLLDRPEFVFTCQSQVLTAQFSPFHPTIIVGGTYSGQLVLWDSRAKTTPVQRSPLSSLGHTHPIYCLDVVGTQNAHNLVSISTDGTMCAWSMDNLTQPLEQIQLESKLLVQKSTAPVAATALSFPEGQVNQFFIGSEEGVLFQGQRHGSNQGVTQRFQGHQAPITGLSLHSGAGAVDLSDLVLTSSLDWTCKLWSRKNPAAFLHSFQDGSDAVYDCQWSPVHPGVFGSVDGTGGLSVWNLAADTEVPVVKEQVCNKALNKLGFSADGKRIACGDSQGTIYIYDSTEFANTTPSDWTAVERSVADLAADVQYNDAAAVER